MTSTYDLSHMPVGGFWGLSYRASGTKLSVNGHTDRLNHAQPGDFVILPHGDGSGDTARYLINTLSVVPLHGSGDPQFFMEATFYPRE